MNLYSNLVLLYLDEIFVWYLYFHGLFLIIFPCEVTRSEILKSAVMNQ